MDIYDLLGLNQIDKEKAIQNSIKETKRELFGLTEELTCKIYSSFLTNSLRKNHILPIRVDTKDLDCPYSHVFHLVPLNEDEFFLIDLTFSQFHNSDFEELQKKGYTKVSNESFNDYLEITGKKRPNISLKKAILKDNKRDGKSL